MKVEKGKTAKYLKEKHPIPKEVTQQLKDFTKAKKNLINALKEKEKTIPQLAKELDLPADKILFQLMTLLKYGLVESGDIDDMDEYFYYKLTNNGPNKS